MTNMTMPTVAKKVFYPCKKCETDRYQVVLAHTSLKTARLECEVCKTKNIFTVEEPKKSRSAVPKKSKKASSNRAAAHVAKWTQLRDSATDKPEPYNMKNLFETGVAVEHPKFGLGFVISSNGQAIQVVFEDEERSLVHNRG
ncbi:MAG: hypothetical protein AB7F86_16335 [Bdellovibrionales bacterium]